MLFRRGGVSRGFDSSEPLKLSLKPTTLFLKAILLSERHKKSFNTVDAHVETHDMDKKTILEGVWEVQRSDPVLVFCSWNRMIEATINIICTSCIQKIRGHVWK